MFGKHQLIAMTGAVGDRAQSGAGYLHRHGVVGIGHQQGGRTVPGHFHDLAEHAAGIDQGLADFHAAVAAGIEHQALPERIQVDIDDAGHAYFQVVAASTAKQLAQALVFLDHGVEPVNPGRRHLQVVALLLVVGLQLAAERQRFLRRAEHPDRRRGQPPERPGHQGQLLPRNLAITIAVIRHHQA